MLALVLNPPACPDGWYDAAAPLELALAAGALRAAGCAVEVLDLEACRLSLADVEGWVGARDYDLIYTAGVNEQADYLRWFSRVAAETRPWAPFLIGGFAAVSLGEKLLRHSLAHAMVIAEPEPVLVAAAAALREGRPLAEVPGLIVRERDLVARTPDQPRPQLDDLARAAWDLFPTDAYLERRYSRGTREVTRALPLLLGRGCPHECAYCLGEEGREVRLRDPQDAAAEADDLHRRLGVRHLMFRGVALPTNDAVSTRLAQLMRERPHLTWEIRTRLDMMTPERLRQFKQAGCVFIAYEPEVLDQGAAPDAALRSERRGFAPSLQSTSLRRCLDVERMCAVLRAHRAEGVPFALRQLICADGSEAASVPADLEALLPRDPANAPVVVRCYPGTALHRDLAGARGEADATKLELFLPSHMEAPQSALTALQAAELRYRVSEFPWRPARLPRLPRQPRIAVIGAARPNAVVAAVDAAHGAYPEGRFMLAVSPAVAARLEWLRDERFRVVSLGEVGPRQMLRELRAMRPHLVVIATDETSGRYSKAKLLALLAGGRGAGCGRRLVYDAVTGGFVGLRGELWREIKARLGRSCPAPAHRAQQLTGAHQPPLEAAVGAGRALPLLFPEVAPDAEARVAPYQFAQRFLDPGDRVLDCACGTGFGSALLAQTGARVTGADASRAAARYARVRYGEATGARSHGPRALPATSIGGRAQRLHFICADAARLPHPDDTFDVAVSFETLGRPEDERAYVAEMSRVLKPQGLLIVSAPWRPWVGESLPAHVRGYTRPQYEALLRERFFVRDLVPQMDGLVNWRLPLGNRMIALCENAKRGGLTLAPGRWSRMRPQVSVIMCTWNAGAYLEEALQSIFDQTFQDFEFLVVDNNSTDGTRERLRAFAHDQGKLRLIPLDENLGVSRGLLVALAHARGRFIARMDADDRSRPQRLARQVEYLLANPEVYLLATRAAHIDREGRATGENFARDAATTYQEICLALQSYCPFSHGSIMLRRELLREVGTYDMDCDEAEDYEFWTRIYRQRPMEVLPEVLFEHRLHERQATQQRRRVMEAWSKCIRLANWWRKEQEGRD